MDEPSNDATGLVAADASSSSDHPVRTWSRAIACVWAAKEALEGSNKQEAQQARKWLDEACEIFDAKGGEACEG
jgi:hypothetical protein